MYHCNWYLKAILPLPYSDVNTRVKRPGVSLDSTMTAAAAAAVAAAAAAAAAVAAAAAAAVAVAAACGCRVIDILFNSPGNDGAAAS